MKLTKFQNTKEEMSAEAYANRMGISIQDINSEMVLVYAQVFYIEVYTTNTHPALYVVYAGRSECQTYNLIEAELHLYEAIKSELPKKKKKKVDTNKFPNGLNSWLQTNFQIVEYMGYHQSKYNKGICTYEGSKVIEELDGQDEKQEFAEDLTTEFENKYKDFDWAANSDNTTFYEELDLFLDAAFYPKKKFKVIAEFTIYAELEIEANSKEEAEEMANENPDDFTPNDKLGGNWEVTKVEEE